MDPDLAAALVDSIAGSAGAEAVAGVAALAGASVLAGDSDGDSVGVGIRGS